MLNLNDVKNEYVMAIEKNDTATDKKAKKLMKYVEKCIMKAARSCQKNILISFNILDKKALIVLLKELDILGFKHSDMYYVSGHIDVRFYGWDQIALF